MISQASPHPIAGVRTYYTIDPSSLPSPQAPTRTSSYVIWTAVAMASILVVTLAITSTPTTTTLIQTLTQPLTKAHPQKAAPPMAAHGMAPPRANPSIPTRHPPTHSDPKPISTHPLPIPSQPTTGQRMATFQATPGPEPNHEPNHGTSYGLTGLLAVVAGITAVAGILVRIAKPKTVDRLAFLSVEGEDEEKALPALASRPSLVPKPSVATPKPKAQSSPQGSGGSDGPVLRQMPKAAAAGDVRTTPGKGRGRGRGRSQGRGAQAQGRGQVQGRGNRQGQNGNGQGQRRFNNEDRPTQNAPGRGQGRGRGRRNDRWNQRTPVKKAPTAEMKRKGAALRREKRKAKADDGPVRVDFLEVSDAGMTVTELAEQLAVGPAEVVKTLFLKGIMASVSQTIDKDTINLVAEHYEIEVLDADEVSMEEWAKKDDVFMTSEDLFMLQPRAAVVCVMGHVDHGKTSLLDYLRKASVAASEAGGITQGIGAYQVPVDMEDGEVSTLTFLDTPGHEAFSAMRARGAKVTDIAIVVVAADDGPQPQTLEAISHAQAAEVPMVMAITKIDKNGADVERVKSMLAEKGIVCEEWGGDVPVLPISSKSGDGVDELLETVSLLAEIEELSANPDRNAAGTVIEAYLDSKRGAVATLLVQAGTLKIGDSVQCGAASGNVRALYNDKLEAEESAGPSVAVQMLGLDVVPEAGDVFKVFLTESEAKSKSAEAAEAIRSARLLAMTGGGNRITLANMMDVSAEEDDKVTRLNVILKADASGSIGAIKSALGALPQDRVMLRFLHAAAGDVTVSDVDLAAASEGIILGFNIKESEAVTTAARANNVEVRTYNVIYDMVDDIRNTMEGTLSYIEKKELIGEARVLAVFGARNHSKVAGCEVTDGQIEKGAGIVVYRKKKVVYEGPITSLRIKSDLVSEVMEGSQCGLGCDGFMDWEEDDRIEVFKVRMHKATLEDASVRLEAQLREITRSMDEVPA